VEFGREKGILGKQNGTESRPSEPGRKKRQGRPLAVLQEFAPA